MNAQDAYNTAQAFNQNQKTFIIKAIIAKIKSAAEKGLVSISISLEEFGSIRTHFETLGYKVSDWGDQRDGYDYRISWGTPNL